MNFELFNRIRIVISLCFLLMAGPLLAQTDSIDNKGTLLIYKFDIRKEIAPPIWHHTQQAFEDAENMNADLVLIHMNTYGGMLESADSIRTKILQSDIPVYVFIDNNAASAGALISISCDSIYMTPAATIGAATVVDQEGKVVPDKYQSYMRAMMRATAEANGRDPDIAQAMVDPRIKIENVIDSGRVITFTSSEAMQNGFCENIANNVTEVLEKAGIDDYKIVEQELKPIDKIIAFLINPIVSGLLIMMIVGGIYFELQSPGIGFPLAAAVTGALLYFAPLYLEGLADHWEIIIFIVGVILVAVEIFAIPGFGVAGISGIVFIIAGLSLSLIGNIGFDFSGVKTTNAISAFFLVITAIFFSILISYWITRALFSENRMFKSLALETVQNVSDGYTSSDATYETMLNREGISHTDLRPAGKVLIEDDVFDATALTGYIEKGMKVKVVKYETGQLFVVQV